MSIICENQISLLKYVNALDISQINKNKRFITLKIKMQRLKEKQLQQLKLKQQKTKHAYRHALDALLNHQFIKILIQFSRQELRKTEVSKIQNINDYSPVSISRLIFSKQLKQIKSQLQKLPNQHKCPLQHFLLIMLKVIIFPFQKSPLYLLGLKQMFRQIKEDQKDEFVSFQQIETYVMGEVVNFNDETLVDTEFQIQFVENKMQDFLMHDNGVKHIYFSNDLKKYIVLDHNSNIIKIYDQNMKMVGKFEPNKEKHNKKHPIIITFDYNELGSKLAVSLSDNTLNIVNLANFIQSSSEEAFRSVFLNQIAYKTSEPIKKIYFLSMMNKWLCIDQQNKVWIYDVQKYREQNQNYCKRFKHPNDDFEIKDVLEIVSLAAVAFVINNQVWFYNQTLSKKKFKKFAHCDQIMKFLYSQQKSQFYFIGKQDKFVTIFDLNKVTGEPNKIWTYQTNQFICDFEVFPYFGSILILDVHNNLKVCCQGQAQLQYQQNYNHIVKKKDLPTKLVKTSKNQFLIHSTYILVLELKKVAIQRDIDFAFLDTFFYDHAKEEIVFSVNGQVMGLSLMHGEIRKSLANENSSLEKHKSFYMGKNTELFVIDDKDSLHQIYPKNDDRYKLNKDHRKAVGITNTKKSFYDQQNRMLIMISESSIYIVKNDTQNNFTLKSCLLLQNFPCFMKHKYFPKTKQLLLLDSANMIYLMNSCNYTVKRRLSLNIFKEENEGQKMILDVQYDEDLEVMMALTNNGEFALFNLNDQKKSIYIKLKDILPYKLKSLSFLSFSYQKIQKSKDSFYSSRVFFYNQTGFIIEFQIAKIINRIIDHSELTQKNMIFTYIKDTHQLDYLKLVENQPGELFKLHKQSIYKPEVPKQATFIKVHDKAIVFSKRIMLQGFQLLTIGQDGHLKLWGQNRKVYFDLRLPLMIKIEWSMNQIHEKRNFRILTETNEFLQTVSKRIKANEQRHILQIHDHKKRLKNKSQKIKIDFDNPIAIEFQNKDLEQMVNSKRQIDLHAMTIDVSMMEKKYPNRMTLTHRVSEPWRKKKQFMQIYQKATTIDKYVQKFKEKMPFDLLLMRNDLHIGENIPIKRSLDKSKQQKLTILPELKNYLKNKQIEQQNEMKKTNPEEKNQEKNEKKQKIQVQNKFQSCLFVKTERGPKKANAFDEIDKYFHRKQQQLLNKRWIPNKRNLDKNLSNIEPKAQNFSFSQGQRSAQIGKIDPLKSVLKIFEEHNKEALNTKRGRLINIPNIEKKSKSIYIKR